MSEDRKKMYPLEPKEPLWTRSFLILTCSYFLMFLCLQMLLSPFPSYVKDRFDPGDFTLSLVTSLFALTAIVTRFATAALMPRVRLTAMLYTGAGISVLATVAYSYAGSVAAVLALRILFGVGFGISSTVMPTIVSRIIPARRMGEGIGYFGLSTNLAMSVGPVIGLTILERSGFAPLTMWGAAAAAAIIPLLVLTRAVPAGSTATSQPATSQPSRSGPESSIPVSGHSLASGGSSTFTPVPARSPVSGLALPIALNALLSACYGGLLSFLVLYGREIGLANIGLFFLFNAATLLAVRPISGRLYDRRGHAPVLIPGALLLVASLTLLSITRQFPMLVCSALLFGLGYGAIQPTIQAWMLGGRPREKHGLLNSLFYNSIDLGVALGSMLLGAVASATSYAVMYRYSAGIMVLFLGLYVVFRGGRRGSSSAAPARPADSTPTGPEPIRPTA
ncbi:MAG: transporter [Paenibacillaceae bacterium]|jgi:MFS family permease|nr:transporter [Paenibacillaceae bacterium]